MWWLFRSILLALPLLAVRALEDFEYTSRRCTDVTDCSECMNSINNEWFDSSKCVPILPSSYIDEKDSSSNGTITCASWQAVEIKQYTINYKCNNDLIPEETKAQISVIPYNVKWAYYARDATPTDTLLSDMVIIESTLAANRAVIGYESTLNYIILSFRGSKNIINFIDDFNFPLTDYVRPGCDGCSVHSGFISSYNSIRTQVMDSLSSLYGKYPNANLLVTGHSLGGAQATFAAIDAQLVGYTSHLYTYGCPRVGNRNFANFVNSQITGVNIRTVYQTDPVPNLPPIAFQFYHSGTEVHFYDCSQYLAYPKFSDEGEIIDLLSILDHLSYECLYPDSQDSEYIKYI